MHVGYVEQNISASASLIFNDRNMPQIARCDRSSKLIELITSAGEQKQYAGDRAVRAAESTVRTRGRGRGCRNNRRQIVE
jgi:hypothetical protein